MQSGWPTWTFFEWWIVNASIKKFLKSIWFFSSIKVVTLIDIIHRVVFPASTKWTIFLCLVQLSNTSFEFLCLYIQSWFQRIRSSLIVFRSWLKFHFHTALYWSSQICFVIHVKPNSPIFYKLRNKLLSRKLSCKFWAIITSFILTWNIRHII